MLAGGRSPAGEVHRAFKMTAGAREAEVSQGGLRFGSLHAARLREDFSDGGDAPNGRARAACELAGSVRLLCGPARGHGRSGFPLASRPRTAGARKEAPPSEKFFTPPRLVGSPGAPPASGRRLVEGRERKDGQVPAGAHEAKEARGGRRFPRGARVRTARMPSPRSGEGKGEAVRPSRSPSERGTTASRGKGEAVRPSRSLAGGRAHPGGEVHRAFNSS